MAYLCPMRVCVRGACPHATHGSRVYTHATCLAEGVGSGGSFVACLRYLINDHTHASLSRRSTVPTPNNRDTSNNWALITTLITTVLRRSRKRHLANGYLVNDSVQPTDICTTAIQRLSSQRLLFIHRSCRQRTNG